MEFPTEADLVARIEGFLERHAMAPTTFGRAATGNPHLLNNLRDGVSPSLRTVQKVIDYMAARDAEQLAADGDLGKTADAARRVA